MRTYGARPALTLRLLREASGEAPPDQPVGASDVAGSGRLSNHRKAHAWAIFGRLRQDGDGRRVDDLVDWMRRHGLTMSSARDVQRAGVAGVRKAEDVEALFRIAKECGAGTVRKTPGGRGGVRFALGV